MNVRITPGALSGRIGDVIASKSQAHRVLICAALADGPTRIECNSQSQDIRATARCIEALGAHVEFHTGGMDVNPIPRALESTDLPTLDCGESGSTLRFMLPLVGALGRKCAFTGQGLLASRPLSPLYEQLAQHGMVMTPVGAFPLRCGGALRSGRYEIAGNVSSQFITGLLIALPLLNGDSEIAIPGRLESEPYVNMTLDALAQFGIRIARANGNDRVYHVAGGQRVTTPGQVRIEGDWSSAAFWLAAGALGGVGVECAPLNANSTQGDRAIVDILERFGAGVERCPGAVRVHPATLGGIELDAADIPDLVPIVAVVAGAARGVTRITSISRLRLKESDRVASVLSMMRALGVEAYEQGGILIIRGRGTLLGGVVDAFNDHRIAMAASIAGSAARTPVTVLGAQACAKSYPGFFEKFAALGGRAEEV